VLPRLSLKDPLMPRAAPFIQTRGAASPAVDDVPVVPAVRAAVVTLVAGRVQGSATPGSGVLGLSAAPLPQLPPDPEVPWPTPSPTSPALQRGLETGSGATDFATIGTTPGAPAQQSVRYAGALTLPGSSGLKGPDQRPD
jgi:hypothetical protein